MKSGRSTGFMVFWEIVLILGSIPLFRSVWVLCDRSGFLNGNLGLLLSLAVGLAVCGMALLALNGKGREQESADGTE